MSKFFLRKYNFELFEQKYKSNHYKKELLKSYPPLMKQVLAPSSSGAHMKNIFLQSQLELLQSELELLLSKVTLRSRRLRKEANIPDPPDKSRKKKGKYSSEKKKDVSEKISSPDYYLTPPEVQSIIHHSVPRTDSFGNTSLRASHPSVCGKVLPDNAQPTEERKETTSKFWAFVEPYVSDFVPEDLKILDQWISQYEAESAEIHQIPPLGKLFVNKWTEEDLAEEKRSSSENCVKSRNTKSTGSDQENVKDILNRAEQICSNSRLELPNNLVERIVGALVDPDLFADDTKNNTSCRGNSESGPEPKRRRLNDDQSRTGVIHPNNNNNSVIDVYKSSCSSETSLDTRIKNTLEEQFKYKVNNPNDEDEILSEIHKYQAELQILCNQNKEQFRRLKCKVEVELDRQEKKATLKAIENEVLELSRKYASNWKILAQDISDGLKILENRQFRSNRSSDGDEYLIFNILQKRTKALNALHGTTSLKC